MIHYSAKKKQLQHAPNVLVIVELNGPIRWRSDVTNTLGFQAGFHSYGVPGKRYFSVQHKNELSSRAQSGPEKQLGSGPALESCAFVVRIASNEACVDACLWVSGVTRSRVEQAFDLSKWVAVRLVDASTPRVCCYSLYCGKDASSTNASEWAQSDTQRAPHVPLTQNGTGQGKELFSRLQKTSSSVVISMQVRLLSFRKRYCRFDSLNDGTQPVKEL
jgi:hypothetical protein